MVMMFYIISYLHYSDTIASMNGGQIMRSTLNLGSIVVGIFSCIFLFYTNSFLIRRRKKEFGLYHILGMGKLNIARILFWETLLTAVISLVLGIGFGILFSKLDFHVVDPSDLYSIYSPDSSFTLYLVHFYFVF
ncbi:MAG: FtsX-like permease family protein [Lachnospiraceae bacterium]